MVTPTKIQHKLIPTYQNTPTITHNHKNNENPTGKAQFLAIISKETETKIETISTTTTTQNLVELK